MKTSIGCALLTFAAGAASVGAHGPVVVEGSSAPTAQVSYSDLNLASASGIATLHGRIRRAAEGLCRSPGVRPLGERLAADACIESAIAGTADQVRQALASYGSDRPAVGAVLVRMGN